MAIASFFLKKQNTIKLGKTLETKSLSLKKRYQEIIEKIKEKARAANKELSRIKEKKTETKKAAAQAKETDGEFSEIKVRNDQEAAGETDEGHPGHRTVKRGGRPYRATCRTCRARHGRETEDCHPE